MSVDRYPHIQDGNALYQFQKLIQLVPNKT